MARVAMVEERVKQVVEEETKEVVEEMKMANEFVGGPSMRKGGWLSCRGNYSEKTREKRRWERLIVREMLEQAWAGVGRCNHCDLGNSELWQSWATGASDGKGCGN